MSNNIVDLGWGFSDSSMTPIFTIHTETIRRVLEFRNTHNIDLTEQINTAILAVVEQATTTRRGSVLEEFAHELATALQTIIDQADLTTREREVIMARWMHDGDATFLNDIAKARGITRERVRSIEAKALRKLREHIGELEHVYRQAAQLQIEMAALRARMSLLEAIRWRRPPESQAQLPEEE